MIRLVLVSVLAFVLGIQVSGMDSDNRHSDWNVYRPAVPQFEIDSMARKLVRGIVNVGTSIGELPKQITGTIRTDGLVDGVTVGPIKGVIMTVVRAGSGLYDVATFYSATPGLYDPVIAPEYVWTNIGDLLDE